MTAGSNPPPIEAKWAQKGDLTDKKGYYFLRQYHQQALS